MKRFLTSLLAITCVMTVLSGCGKGADSSSGTATDTSKAKPVKIVFACNETALLTKDFWQTVSDKYMKAHTNVTIQNIYQPSSSIPIRDYEKTLLATSQFPDVMVMTAPGDFVPSGALLEIPDSDVSSYLADLKLGLIGGKRYFIPYKKQLSGVFYNKKMFSDNGIKVPNTYADFIKICDAFLAKGITPVTEGIKDGWTQTPFASAIISTDILTSDSNWGLERNKGQKKYNSSEMKAAYTKYQTIMTKYANKDITSTSYTQTEQLFFTGKSPMMPMGTWLQGDIAKANLSFEPGFFTFPGDKDDNIIVAYTNEGLSISAKTGNPDVAKDFVKFFMTDKEWYGKFLQTEQLFSTTKDDVTYDMTPLRKEIGQMVQGKKQVEMFDSMTGDSALLPGLQTTLDKVNQQTAVKDDIEKNLTLLDSEWDKANSNIQK